MKQLYPGFDWATIYTDGIPLGWYNTVPLSNLDHKVVTDRHLLILHGFRTTTQQMLPWAHKLLASPASKDRYVWLLSYDWTAPLPTMADGLNAWFTLMRTKGHSFSDVNYFTYSLGGLVARSAIATHSLPCNRLASLCSPHLGVMPTGLSTYLAKAAGNFWPSAKDLLPGSNHLMQLNSSSGDVDLRKNYHFSSMAFTAPQKGIDPIRTRILPNQVLFDHDTVVAGSSARAEGLLGVNHRASAIAHYPKYRPTVGTPHAAPLDPRLTHDLASDTFPIIKWLST